MFTGKAKHTVNKDGRLSIPSKMRDVIKKKYDPDDLFLILMPGNVVCLYPGREFETLTHRFENPQGASIADIMAIERICAEAEPCKLDGSGRIVIPPILIEAGGLGSEVLVVGARSHIEIWNEEHWNWNQSRNRSVLEGFKAWPVRQSQDAAQSPHSPQTVPTS
ncbi:division/cell wall cluster transcriptional repressor MraZ [Candidatus Poribacteria bacterium]|nr:division/cell wall cluster transcriptional repressor MraZ [Candidatus Poribacteria bacterium]